jgi:hypothetical protein
MNEAAVRVGVARRSVCWVALHQIVESRRPHQRFAEWCEEVVLSAVQPTYGLLTCIR